MMVHIGPRQIFSPLGWYPEAAPNGGKKRKFWQFWPISKPFDGEYLKNDTSEHYVAIRA